MGIIEIRNLSKKYGKKTALDNVNLSIASGKIIGLLGPNGSGKTTLLKILAGISTKKTGQILISGLEIGRDTKEIVSYLPDVSYIGDKEKIKDIIKLFDDFYVDFDVDVAKEMFSSLNIDIKLRYRTLSKGNKEKVQLILVMSRRANVYLLDEPIAGVDPLAREFILNTIIKNYNRNATIIMSTHLVHDIENIVDEVVFINNSKIIDVKSVADIKRDKTIDEYYREVFSYATN